MSANKEDFLNSCGYKITQISSYLRSVSTLTAKQALKDQGKIEEFIKDVLLEISENDNDFDSNDLKLITMTMLKWHKYFRRVIFVANEESSDRVLGFSKQYHDEINKISLDSCCRNIFGLNSDLMGNKKRAEKYVDGTTSPLKTLYTDSFTSPSKLTHADSSPSKLYVDSSTSPLKLTNPDLVTSPSPIKIPTENAMTEKKTLTTSTPQRGNNENNNDFIEYGSEIMPSIPKSPNEFVDTFPEFDLEISSKTRTSDSGFEELKTKKKKINNNDLLLNNSIHDENNVRRTKRMKNKITYEKMLENSNDDENDSDIDDENFDVIKHNVESSDSDECIRNGRKKKTNDDGFNYTNMICPQEIKLTNDNIVQDDFISSLANTKFVIPDMDDGLFKCVLEHLSKKGKNFSEVKKEYMKFKELFHLIEERNKIFNQILNSTQKDKNHEIKPNKLIKKELQNLYEHANNCLYEAFKKIAEEHGIPTEKKSMTQLLKPLGKAPNNSSLKKPYAAFGDVKSMTSLIMTEDQIPCPFTILCCLIQHVVVNGPEYALGKVGVTRVYHHDNVFDEGNEGTALLVKRYDKKNGNYYNIDETSFLYVGNYQLMFDIEATAIHAAGLLGIKANSRFDIHNRQIPKNESFYEGLGCLYFVKIKYDDPVEYFLQRSIPYTPPSGFTFSLYSMFAGYKKIKNVLPCYLCDKVIAITDLAKHIVCHQISDYERFADNGWNKSPFKCYENMCITYAIEFVEKFSIKDPVNYFKSMDSMLLDVFIAINNIFNIGVFSSRANVCEFQDFQKDAYYDKKKLTISSNKENQDIKNLVLIKNFKNFYRNLFASSTFQETILKLT